ncbi:MAG: tetratricopeptide repeat protein [Pseudomonadota bacterium]
MSKSLELRFLKAKRATKRGEHVEAKAIYEEILRQFPANSRAKADLAAIQPSTSDITQYIDSAQDDEIERLTSLYHARRFEEVIENGASLLKRHPELLILHRLLGVTYAQLGRMNESIDHLNSALEINPCDVDVLNNLGVALKRIGQHAEALISYDKAIKINPADAELHYNRGNILAALGRRSDALAAYESALKFQSDHAGAYNNLGTLLETLGRRPEAVTAFEQAVRYQPDFVAAHNNLGGALGRLGHYGEAVAVYERVLRSHPDNVAARLNRLLTKAQICDWENIAGEVEFLRSTGVTSAPLAPLRFLALDDDPMRNKIRSERYSVQKYPQQSIPFVGTSKAEKEKIRIGYFSADFHNHATMYLMAGLFEQHDRNRFEIHVYSYGPDSDDEMRQRLRAAVDVFHDVREFDDVQVVELARREQIDIAVDLKGHTSNTRLGIFALRAAPIQISYLGYPGTSGADFIDYIVADTVVIPADQRQHYSEKIIYLPGSYQVNDDRRPISERAMTRSQEGLPAQGFVFCCFNNSYKITPTEFEIWMRLLSQVDDSVLWLLKTHPTAENNLRQEATRHGIDPTRLIFAQQAPQAEHLARIKLADLFLDTFAYNAHTTASDALWAGVPVLTLAGQGFAARVAASLLTAAGSPEMITTTVVQYERLALDLATAPGRLAVIKRKTVVNRKTSALFDTRRFTLALEEAYAQIATTYRTDGPRNDIYVQDTFRPHDNNA